MPGAFSEEWLSKVRDANDILDIISSYVNMRPKGKNYWGNCPFHREKTPSFSVNTDKQMYYCFGCHVGGNVIKFIMEIEKLNFYDAVKQLAERANIPMEQVDDGEYQKERALQEKLYKLNKLAARYYYDTLRSETGKGAVRYLMNRGISGETINKFGLGFAPEGPRAFVEYAQTNGFTPEELVSGGLAVNRDGRYTDMFRNRVIFPIISQYGKVIGFGGRVMDDSKPKYLNSPETKVFNKRRNLYALNIVKNNVPLNRILLVEGYMDVIALHQAGFGIAVASLGTALTVEQLSIIRRYTPNLYLAYDGDSAGRNATLKALDLARKADIKAHILELGNLDPDEFIREKGKPAFEQVLETAHNEIDFKLELAAELLDLTTPEGKKEYAIRSANILRLIRDPVELEDYIARIATRTGYSTDALQRQVGMTGELDLPPVREQKVSDKTNLEWHILHIILHSREMFEYFENQGGSALLRDNLARELYEYVSSRHALGKITNERDILTDFSEHEAIGQIAALCTLDTEYSDDRMFLDDCIHAIGTKDLKEKRSGLVAQLSEFVSDPKKSLEILIEIKELDKQIANCEKV